MVRGFAQIEDGMSKNYFTLRDWIKRSFQILIRMSVGRLEKRVKASRGWRGVGTGGLWHAPSRCSSHLWQSEPPSWDCPSCGEWNGWLLLSVGGRCGVDVGVLWRETELQARYLADCRRHMRRADFAFAIRGWGRAERNLVLCIKLCLFKDASDSES